MLSDENRLRLSLTFSHVNILVAVSVHPTLAIFQYQFYQRLGYTFSMPIRNGSSRNYKKYTFS